MATVEPMRPQQQLQLQGIPWNTYVLLRELPENEHVRMIYDRGDLEMMSPSRRHEQFASLIDRLIGFWALDLNIDIASCRTMTVKREDLERGLEPDNCYYVQNEPLVRTKGELDFSVDPPPDLAIEIDVTRTTLGKMSIYAVFGVPEVWRYDGKKLTVYHHTTEGQYHPRDESGCFPRFPVVEAARLLAQAGVESEMGLVRAFRAWVRANGPSPQE
jgi:Uma2 family endonuclease